MTTQEAHILGWVYGRLAAALPADYDSSGFKFGAAAARPLSGFAVINSAAIDAGVMTEELTREIGEMLSRLDAPAMPEREDAPLPLPLQGAWQLGYFRGKSGAPIANQSLAAQRKAANLSQAELAERIGVDQSVISRWESGKAMPSPEMQAKLSDVLRVGR